MDYNETKSMFEKMIMSRWPQWNPNEVQKADWIASLGNYTFDEIKSAVFEYVQNFDMYTCPKLNVILKLLRKHSEIRRRRKEKLKTPAEIGRYLTIEQRQMLKLKILAGPDTPAKRFLMRIK